MFCFVSFFHYFFLKYIILFFFLNNNIIVNNFSIKLHCYWKSINILMTTLKKYNYSFSHMAMNKNNYNNYYYYAIKEWYKIKISSDVFQISFWHIEKQ